MKENMCWKFGVVFICGRFSQPFCQKDREECSYFAPIGTKDSECKYLLHGVKCNSKRAKEDASVMSKLEEL